MQTSNQFKSGYHVAYFNNCYSVNSVNIDILDFISSIKTCIYEYRIQQIRNQTDKTKRNKIKQSLPCICTSATFKGSRNLQNVESTTGLISIDIDNCEQIDVFTELLKKDKYTFCLFRSPSGSGIKIIVKAIYIISSFTASFLALSIYYKKKYNIEIDPACKDITRLMFVSSDSNIFYNLDSNTFTLKLVIDTPPCPNPLPQKTFSKSNYTEKIITKIKASQIDITSTYSDWIKIGYALVNEFGINGINYFIQISQYYPKFNQIECEKVYRSCYRSGSSAVSIKSLYKIAAWYGISYKD